MPEELFFSLFNGLIANIRAKFLGSSYRRLRNLFSCFQVTFRRDAL
jgi:hypothetical protein